MKWFFIITAVVLAIIGTITSSDVLKDVYLTIIDRPILLLLIIVAVLIQLCGHVLRAKRTKLLIDQAAPSSLRFQFSMLSVGYLFNVLLPFRIGELVRSLLVAKRLRISTLYTFTSVVIERIIDVVFLSTLVIIGSSMIGGRTASGLAIIALSASIFSVAILIMIWLLKNENRYILSIVSSISKLFNTRIRNKLRFKVWSLIFGLQSFWTNKRLVRKYIIYALVSWLCYFVSSLIIVMMLLNSTNILQTLVNTISPYVVSPVIGPVDVGAYQKLTSSLPITMGIGGLILYSKIIWVVLELPMALIGIISLFLYKTKKSTTNSNSYSNKLLRYEDISQDFPGFLDAYFKNHSLSRILHKIEVHGDISLVKFFRGGSDAVTILALREGKLFVKKVVSIEYLNNLKNQYKWLKKYSKSKYFVKALSETRSDDYYSIDLAYNPEDIPLFEYIHTNPVDDSIKIIDRVISHVYRDVYKLSRETNHFEERDEYIKDRLINKVEKAIKANKQLALASSTKKIVINSEKYDNFSTIFEKIKSDNRAWSDLARYRYSSSTHGDLTVDNILVNVKTKDPLIIDPSDDNQIRGPLIDFARLNQSLIVGYEFLNLDEEQVTAKMDGKTINVSFRDHKSAKYMQLHGHFLDVVVNKYLTETERKTLLFHTGLLYLRMLTHRVVINPRNAVKYYAVGVMLLNKYYDQYR